MNSGIGLVFNSERREKQHYIIFELFMNNHFKVPNSPVFSGFLCVLKFPVFQEC